jgi:hypothetical protein
MPIIVGAEEHPIEAVLRQTANRATPHRELYFWNIVQGWNDNGSDQGSAIAALGRIAKTSGEKPAI